VTCEQALDAGDRITAKHVCSWLLDNVQMCGWLDELRERVQS
jgi:hypothetical protein